MKLHTEWTWEEWVLQHHRPLIPEEGLSYNDIQKMRRCGIVPREWRAQWMLQTFGIPDQSRLETWVSFGPASSRWEWLYPDPYECAPSDSCREPTWATVGRPRPQCSSACIWQPLPTGESSR